MRTILVFIRQLKTIHTTQVTIFSCWTTVTHVWCGLIPAACFSKLGLLIDATLPSIAWWRLVHVRHVHIILLSSTLGYIYVFTLNPHRLTLPLWFCLFYSFNTLLRPSWATLMISSLLIILTDCHRYSILYIYLVRPKLDLH